MTGNLLQVAESRCSEAKCSHFYTLFPRFFVLKVFCTTPVPAVAVMSGPSNPVVNIVIMDLNDPRKWES